MPAEILLKPNNLTKNERNIVTQHPVCAKDLFAQIRKGSLRGISDFLVPLAMNSAMFHHEWWNGEGYPYGLSSMDIPLIARITAVCDAYDAMTSDRAYQKARPHRFASEELEKHAGTQFGPRLVSTFFRASIQLPAIYR